ncbi:saccharopine dehydrogenase NADP-binding domain-containing protein [Psychrobacter maritimus]|nr:saccharopine dehydrogenase NADP-binding domain-containing protein [Psychrobacter sp. WB2]WGV13553.1 saccharopine dehydrogenase NADP-binding domain-containing protein [Psychrobacter sp. WB2]
MKVLAIGGSGGMGRAAVRAAMSFDFVSEIIVAGIDSELAERFVAELNSKSLNRGNTEALKKPVRALYLDVTDNNSLRQAIRDVDVVLNSAGPFFRFGVPILTAAIEEGKHYCDICDDWQPTVEMLKLSARAKQNNVTAVIGLGASPGISNLLCVKAATALDEVDTIVSAWKLSGAVNADDGFSRPANEGQVDAAAVHLIHCLSEDIRVLAAGKMVDKKPLAHSKIDFPRLGELDVWSLGHPEAVTLNRRFPRLKNCYNGMLGIDDIVDNLRQIASAVAAGQMAVEDAAR